jgi:hypothetical protein
MRITRLDLVAAIGFHLAHHPEPRTDQHVLVGLGEREVFSRQRGAILA